MSDDLDDDGFPDNSKSVLYDLFGDVDSFLDGNDLREEEVVIKMSEYQGGSALDLYVKVAEPYVDLLGDPDFHQRYEMEDYETAMLNGVWEELLEDEYGDTEIRTV